jgi:AraC family transcriptional regulator of adaptative response/methylated-DNA-[protein]-cysteine methyltransferase
MTLTFEEKYQAILKKDSRYEGLFITAVKSTGIFCRPVCTARKPKVENVEFFDSPIEALNHGYRPCKMCKPMKHAGEVPTEIKELLQHVERAPEVKVRDIDLINKGMEPNTIRRWFKKHYGMTFHDYHRKLRVSKAHDYLTLGKSVTHTAFDTGYDSLSGFSDSMQKIFFTSPSKARKIMILNVIRITTPLGPMIACACSDGIRMLEFADRDGIEIYINKLSKQLGATVLPGLNQHLESLQMQVRAYFQGQRKTFNLPLIPAGTTFQKSVWDALLDIPYGQTRTYSQQALTVGRPSAIRAVAAANGQNRIAIIIPCHRVIGKNGELRGYAGGINRKKYLLELEGHS